MNPIAMLSRAAERLLELPLVYRLRQLVVDKNLDGSLHTLVDTFRGLHVMELGCGPGTNAPLFEEAASFLGVDHNPAYIRKAQARFPKMRFVAADAVGFSAEHPIDLVLIDSFLHHIDDDGARSILASAARTVANRGVVILIEPMLARLSEPYHYLHMRIDRGDHFRSNDHWHRLVAESGLVVERQELFELRVFGFPSHHMLALRLRAANS